VTTQGNGRTVLVGPGEGARLPVLDIVHKVTAEDSGGSLTVEEWGLPPGVMIPPHTHAREDEVDFVLEGELTCYVGGEVVVAPVGSYVLKPRGVPHAFYNAGSETARVLGIVAPGGLEGYFDEYEQIASTGPMTETCPWTITFFTPRALARSRTASTHATCSEPMRVCTAPSSLLNVSTVMSRVSEVSCSAYAVPLCGVPLGRIWNFVPSAVKWCAQVSLKVANALVLKNPLGHGLSPTSWSPTAGYTRRSRFLKRSFHCG
jgi:quercetin dioxygenase-like cupin family protein